MTRYTIGGNFLNFRNSSAFSSKELDLNTAIWKYTDGSPFYPFHELEKTAIRLHGAEELVMDVYGGMLLFLHIPAIERQRINDQLQGRDLYINWINGGNVFYSFIAKLTSITKLYNRAEIITLDELIGFGKILQKVETSKTFDTNTIQGIKDNFYVTHLILHKQKRWLRTVWYWTLGITYIKQDESTIPQ